MNLQLILDIIDRAISEYNAEAQDCKLKSAKNKDNQEFLKKVYEEVLRAHGAVIALAQIKETINELIKSEMN